MCRIRRPTRVIRSLPAIRAPFSPLWRRSIGVHLLPGHARFRGTGGGYIYARYRRRGERVLDQSHFPVTWSRDGTRTDFIEDYLATGRIY